MKLGPTQTRFRLSTLFALATLLATSAQSSLADDATAAAGADSVTGRAGVRVYVDPETGEFTAPPPDETVRPSVEASLSETGEGLVEKPAPSGGFTVDLKGRFQAPVIAIPQADGSIDVRHGELPASDHEATK